MNLFELLAGPNEPLVVGLHRGVVLSIACFELNSGLCWGALAPFHPQSLSAAFCFDGSLLLCASFARAFLDWGPIMPGDPKECRDHALRCLELAKMASSPQVRANFLDLANTWSRLAADLEATLAMVKIMESDDKPPD